MGAIVTLPARSDNTLDNGSDVLPTTMDIMMGNAVPKRNKRNLSADRKSHGVQFTSGIRTYIVVWFKVVQSLALSFQLPLSHLATSERGSD